MRVSLLVSALVVLSALVCLSSAQLAGGRHKVDVNDPMVQEAAQFALRRIQASSNSIETYQLNRVVSAESQVVSGVKYYLTIEVQRGTNGTPELHEVSVWSRPWLQSAEHMQLVDHKVSA